MMKLTKERIAWLRPIVDAAEYCHIGTWGGDAEWDVQQDLADALDDIAQLEAKSKLYQQRITFEQACRFADAQNDYDMAAYALRDLPLTKEAELADLAQAMQSEGCSKGDWVGLRDLWDKAYRKALGGEGIKGASPDC